MEIDKFRLTYLSLSLIAPLRPFYVISPVYSSQKSTNHDSVHGNPVKEEINIHILLTLGPVRTKGPFKGITTEHLQDCT